MQQIRSPRIEGTRACLRVTASANRLCVRREGRTELRGDVFLRCAYEGNVPPPLLNMFVILNASFPIGSRIHGPLGCCEVVLFEVGRPGATAPVLGTIGQYGNMLTFSVTLADIRPHEVRIFQITNLRGQAYVSASVLVSVAGTAVENPPSGPDSRDGEKGSRLRGQNRR